ncbi:unnamed protein product [Hymenolepis diminuta]|uniref:Uncharacterized protein n=1 Tax=Hymenolepis diminuta TaxID=6216 RepID=A0A564XYA7_HYMDI|nr:unnamed protein product [Hymenolepis diminuta]
MLQKLNSEQLQAAIDENATYTTRELSKIFTISRHMTIYREMETLRWEIVRTWEMRFVRNQQTTVCDLLCFTSFP